MLVFAFAVYAGVWVCLCMYVCCNRHRAFMREGREFNLAAFFCPDFLLLLSEGYTPLPRDRRPETFEQSKIGKKVQTQEEDHVSMDVLYYHLSKVVQTTTGLSQSYCSSMYFVDISQL